MLNHCVRKWRLSHKTNNHETTGNDPTQELDPYSGVVVCVVRIQCKDGEPNINKQTGEERKYEITIPVEKYLV